MISVDLLEIQKFSYNKHIWKAKKMLKKYKFFKLKFNRIKLKQYKLFKIFNCNFS